MESEKGPKKSLLVTLWKQRQLQMMILPGIILLIIFSYIPMTGIQIAFKNFRITGSMWTAQWVGMQHFREFFTDDRFVNIMVNTLGISFINLIFGFPLPIIFALLLNELRIIKFKRVVQTISYLPHFLSWVVLGGILITWLSRDGMVNDLFNAAGFTSERISYLGQPKYFWFIAFFSDAWKGLGWSAIIYLAAIASIDQEMYEAATIDGATKFQKALHITLPSIIGTISILWILRVANMLNTNFDQIFMLQNVLNQARSTTIDIYVYQMGMRAGRFSFATAIGLFRSVSATILLISANMIAKKLFGRGVY